METAAMQTNVSVPSFDVLTLQQSPRLSVVHAVAGAASACGVAGRAHVHRFFELVYIAAGAGQHRVQDSLVP
jgi:hypothetical protein